MTRILAFLLVFLSGVAQGATAFQRDAGTADTIGATLTTLNAATPTYTCLTSAYNPATDAIAGPGVRRQRTQVIGTTNYSADLIEGIRTNLLPVGTSGRFDQWTAAAGATVTADTTAGPTGEVTAQTITDPGASLSSVEQTFTVANDGLVHVFSIYVLKTTGATAPTFGVTLALTGGTPVTTNARIDTDDGTQEYGSNANTYVETSSAGTWYRVVTKVTNNTSGNTTLTLDVYPAASAHNASVDNAAATGSAICTLSSLEKAAFASSVISNRNVLLQTQTLNTSWTKTRITVTTDSTANPIDGATNADTIVEDGTAASTHVLSQSFTKSAAASQTFTFSTYILQSGRTWALVSCNSSVSSALGAGMYFDVANGAKGTAVTTAGWTLTSSNITAVGSWYRCDITVVSDTNAAIIPQIYTATGDVLAIHNGNSAAALICWGNQLVYGLKPQTYWANTTASGLRAVPLLLSTTTLSTANGTAIAVMRPYGWSGDQDGSTNFTFYQSTSNGVSMVRSGATTFNVSRLPASGSAQVTSIPWAPAHLVSSSTAFTYNAAAVTAFVNGAQTGTPDTTIATPFSAVSSVAVGSAASSVLQIYGWELNLYEDPVLPPSSQQIFANGVTP